MFVYIIVLVLKLRGGGITDGGYELITKDWDHWTTEKPLQYIRIG